MPHHQQYRRARLQSGAHSIANVQKAAKQANADIQMPAAATTPQNTVPTPSFMQFFVEEEGAMADQTISVTKFQNFIFTIIAVVAFCALLLSTYEFPDLDKDQQNLLWLIGASHAGHVGGKIPKRA